MTQLLSIRPACEQDWQSLWAMLRPTIRAGEVFAFPLDMQETEARDCWFAAGDWCFVAEADGKTIGSYYLRANQRGGGSHVANGGYVTAAESRGRGVASQMCSHSIDQAKALGFRAIQFNFVVSTNFSAVHLWQKHGFKIIATLPSAFRHPESGFVDAFVMWRQL